MLGWTIFFLIISVISGVFGFTGISVATAGAAKIIFFVFLALLVFSVVMMWV